jgi:RimJ/RimL family protein N-acetyltransferase
MAPSVPSAEPPQLVINGRRAALGPLRRELLPVYARWGNDPEVARGLGTVGVHTEESLWSGFYERVFAGDRSQVHFTVYDRDDLAPVGRCALIEIDHRRGIATFGIWLGERRGQGIGTEATRLTLEWGFTVLGLYNIDLTVLAWNTAAIRVYAKAGFREIGRRRGAVVSMGRRFDEVHMDAIAGEFSGGALAHLVPDGGDPLH